LENRTEGGLIPGAIFCSRSYRAGDEADRGMLHGLFAAVLALVAAAGWSQQPAVVQLHHRSAESLMMVLRPLVAPATLAGAGTQLQVLASPSDLPRVLRLIEQSDRPPRPLAIALSDQPPTSRDDHGGAEAPARAGSVTLSTGRAMPGDQYGNGWILSTQPGGRSAADVLEGEPLRISMPASRSLWFGVHGVRGNRADFRGAAKGAHGGVSAATGAAGVAHFDAVSDFTARIWLADATVAIELRPLATGAVDVGPDPAPDHPTVYGRLGQWIALADPGADLQTTSRGEPRTGLWIKVDAVPGPVESR
jgi:hypothetical protein